MSIIQIVVIIVVVGVLLYLANRFIKMDPTVQKILNAFVIIVLVLWLCFIVLRAAGVNTGATI